MLQALIATATKITFNAKQYFVYNAVHISARKKYNQALYKERNKGIL